MKAVQHYGLAFTVYGDPVPQGSKRAIVNQHTGKPAVIESGGARLKTWRQDVTAAARDIMDGSPHEGPTSVELLFHLRRPQRPKHALPVTRPDVDKMARAVLDAITAAGVIRDDAQVTTLLVRKRYTTKTPCVDVFVDVDA